MKFVRPLLIALSFVVVIVSAALVLVLIPSIQRRLVLRVVASHPDLKMEAGHVAAGFSSVILERVHIEKRGVRVGLDRLKMTYSLWPLLFSHTLSIRSLDASGLTVDASHRSRAIASAASAGVPAALPGLLTEIKLPFEVVLDDCHLAGRVLMPGAAGEPPLEAEFEIKGGKFSPGEEGSLRMIATVKNPAAGADVGTLHAQIGLRAVQTTERSFRRVNVAAVVNAAGPSLSEQNQLKITSELTRNSAGENYFLSVDTLLHGAAENLLGLRAALPAGTNAYDGSWTIKARTAQLAPFFLGLGLPDFGAQGNGRVSYAPTSRAMGLQGNLDATASHLEVFDPAWRAIGPINLHAQFDVTADGPVARLRQLDVKLDGEHPVLEFSASQAAEIDFSDRRVRVGGVAQGEALNLKLRGVPLAWVAPFLPGVEISGTPVTGEFSITGGTNQMRFHAIQPLHIGQLTIAGPEGALLTQTEVTLAMDAVLNDRDLQAKIDELTLQTASGDFLGSRASVTIPIAAHPPVSVESSFTADLPTLLKPWLPKGQVKASGSADFSIAAGKIEIGAASTNIQDASGDFLLSMTALHPFVFDPSTRTADALKASGDLVKIELGRIPLDWIPLSQPGLELSGFIEPTKFVFSLDGQKNSLRAVAPFRITGISLSRDGEPALSGLTVEAAPSFETFRGTATMRTGDVSVRGPEGVPLLACKDETVQSPVEGMKSTFTFTLDVPALATQPYFAGARGVSGGRASGEVRATSAATRQIEARLTVNGLVPRDGGQLLPVANLSFRAVLADSGKIAVQAPLLLDRAGQRSDLNFSFELTPSGRTYAVEGKLEGDHVELPDAAAVLGVFSTSAARASREDSLSSGAMEKIAADKTSAWSRFHGRVLLDVKSATIGKDWAMTGFNGVVTMEPRLIALQKLEASFGVKSSLNATAEIRFAPGAQPYRSTGDFTLTQFDAGNFFKAIEPGRAPTVDGLFDVSGHFAGAGETIDRTMTRTHGQFDLTSRQGVFRGLQRMSGKVSMTSKAVEIGASVLGPLLGSEKVTKAAEKVAGQAYFIDQLAQSLGEFNYDQLNVRLVRDESLNLAMEDIGLISPEIRLLGSGSVTYAPGKPFLEQPMNVSLSLAARGKIEQLLGKLRLLDGTRDEVGYARAREKVTIGGSLAKPDPGAFFARILTAKASDLPDSD